MSNGRILLFLIVSLFVMLLYAGLNMFVTNHAEKVISQAPQMPEGMGTQAATSRACELARDRYDHLVSNPRSDGNWELHDKQINDAMGQMDRTCS